MNEIEANKGNTKYFLSKISCVIWFECIAALFFDALFFVIYLWMNERIYAQEVSLYALSLHILCKTINLCDSH
jgi:hypothetical protein